MVGESLIHPGKLNLPKEMDSLDITYSADMMRHPFWIFALCLGRVLPAATRWFVGSDACLFSFTGL